MPRQDLLHLSPEALTQLTNAGLVKRAVRELAAGYRPQLHEDAQGTLTADFSDGVQSVLPTGVPLPDARCSCGAATLCRHRLIAVLAYRESLQEGQQDNAQAEGQAPPASGAAPAAAAKALPQADDSPRPATPATALQPEDVGLTPVDALARLLPASLLQRAERRRAAGLSIELRRRASGEPCDTARLPSATVRFWAGPALEAARCDCAQAMACEHVALGVWAFQQALAKREPGQAAPASETVRLGDAGSRHALNREPFEHCVEALLRHGVSRGAGPLMQALSNARMASQHAAWLSLLVADLEAWCEAYAQRSALYDAAQGVDLLAELALRLAAGVQAGHAEAVLGVGQVGETPLDRLRLMSLGARTVRDGEARRTQLVMADIDTGTRLVLSHEWRVPESAQAPEAEEARQRASERLAPGVMMEALAQGQMLSQQAARRPDGSVRLARARSSQNSVLPQSADWAMLGSPVRFDSIQALVADQQAHPHAALQPRHAARRFVVFSPAKVGRVAYDPHAQAVLAELMDAEGQPLMLGRTFERHVPHALDALAAALSGRSGPLRHVAGVLSWVHGRPHIDPWALACEGLIVPDMANATGALADLPLGISAAPQADACTRLLAQLRQQLGTLLHNGLGMLPRSWPSEAEGLARQLAQAGLQALAAEYQALVPAIMAKQAAPTAEPLASQTLRLLALLQLHLDGLALG